MSLIVRIYFVLLFIYSYSTGYSQKDDYSKVITNSKYLSFLIIPTEKSKSAIVYGGIKHLYLPSRVNFRTGGLHISFGLNIARFLTDKIVFGVDYDFKPFLGRKEQHFSRVFIQDFNESFNNEYANKEDSIRAKVLYSSVNNLPYGISSGNKSYNYGFSISLFPQRFGGIMLSVKKGKRMFPFFNKEGNGEVFILRQKNNYIIELTCKPYTFFKQSNIKINDEEFKVLYKNLTLGFYFERISIQEATYDFKPLNLFVNNSFISKYYKSNRFGLKIGIGLY